MLGQSGWLALMYWFLLPCSLEIYITGLVEASLIFPGGSHSFPRGSCSPPWEVCVHAKRFGTWVRGRQARCQECKTLEVPISSRCENRASGCMVQGWSLPYLSYSESFPCLSLLPALLGMYKSQTWPSEKAHISLRQEESPQHFSPLPKLACFCCHWYGK